jgi:hypothetical protein
MKDASDLRSKAKDRRRARRGANESYKDADRMDFKDKKSFDKHEREESAEEADVERTALKDKRKVN